MKRHPARKIIAAAALLFCAVHSTATHGAGQPSAFLEKHCVNCHDSETKKGGLDLTALKMEFADAKGLAEWIRVHDRVRDGEMPPPKRQERPDAMAVKNFTAQLGGQLAGYVGARQAELGRARARRLNRAEYESTLHDLLGVAVPLAALLPEDAKAGGFENQAEAQSLSPVLIEKYLEAADVALETAFATALQPVMSDKRRFTVEELKAESPGFYGGSPTPRAKDVVFWNLHFVFGGGQFYGRMPMTKITETGRYRIRVRALAVNVKGGNLPALLRYGICTSASPQMERIGWLDLGEMAREFEFVTWLERGGILHLRPEDESPGRPIAPFKLKDRADNEKAGGVGAAVEWIEIERLPAGPNPKLIQQRLFGDIAVQPASSPKQPARVLSKSPEQDVPRLMRAFAAAAFRRPVTDNEVAPYSAFAREALKAGATFEDALRAGYRALLASPRFLYFQEKAGALDDHALASRLSYFLTGSMPDEALRRAAEAGQLRQPATLRAHAERLLASDGTRAFSERFAAQWLKLREIDFTVPDTVLYPEFDTVLQLSMLGETHAFLAELLQRDLSVVHLARSDFAMLNERLARHYGIAGPRGLEFQKIALPPGSPRGGLLGQASVLKVTANGTTTSPVLRGVWVLERLLGQPVPPPPANVGAVEPDIRGAKTIRDQLDKHRNSETCSACHAKIDPPGFALENFDVIGGWRDTYRKIEGETKKAGWKPEPLWKSGLPVNARGALADGRAFSDIRTYRDLIASNPDALARNLATKLVTFATGAGISFADRADIEAIVQRAKARNYGTRTLLLEVIQSPLFTRK